MVINAFQWGFSFYLMSIYGRTGRNELISWMGGGIFEKMGHSFCC